MKTDARKLSREALIERRKQAIRLYQKLGSIKQTAEVVGSTEKTVGNWVKIWKTDGIKALKPKISGRKKGEGMSLSKSQQKHIQKMIVDKNPDQLKMDFALWNRLAVQCLIEA